VSTLLALADRLGLELLLVPKEAAQAVSAGTVTQPVVTSRVQGALDRVRTLQPKHRGLREARASLDDARSVSPGMLPVSRLKASDVVSQGWVDLSQATLYRAVEAARFYCTTPKGRSIGKEFPVWQFVEPVPELIAPILSQLAEQPSSEIHAFRVTGVDELNELSPAEVLAGKPFETRKDIHRSQRTMMELPAGLRVRTVHAVAAHHLGNMADTIG
jgi:hypothetical protein